MISCPRSRRCSLASRSRIISSSKPRASPCPSRSSRRSTGRTCARGSRSTASSRWSTPPLSPRVVSPTIPRASLSSDPSLDHDNPLEEVYEDQLMSADLVVLNKADLIDKDQLEALKAQIAQAVPRAVKIAPAREGVIGADVLLGLSAAAEDDLAARPSHHDAEGEHDHDDFDTFVVTIPAVRDPDTLIDRLIAATRAHDILRVKGFIEGAGKPLRMLVQGGGQRFRRDFDRPWGVGEPRLSRLVVIAERGVDREAIASALGA